MSAFFQYSRSKTRKTQLQNRCVQKDTENLCTSGRPYRTSNMIFRKRLCFVKRYITNLTLYKQQNNFISTINLVEVVWKPSVFPRVALYYWSGLKANKKQKIKKSYEKTNGPFFLRPRRKVIVCSNERSWIIDDRRGNVVLRLSSRAITATR